MNVFSFARSPDIIRANQKDAHVETILKDQLENVLRQFKGARFVHKYASEIGQLSTLLYLSLTTLIGSRTLGEEYCDLFYVTSKRRLTSWQRRAAYIALATFGTKLIEKSYNKLRSRVLEVLQKRLDNAEKTDKSSKKVLAISLIKSLIESMTDSTILTINLMFFYFYGSYYQLSKRLLGLRYIFGHKVDPMETQAGYEFLGVLVAIQFIPKIWSQVHQLITQREEIIHEKKRQECQETESAYTLGAIGSQNASSLPLPPPTASRPSIDLSDSTLLPYIKEQSRTCTLCLSYMTDPAATLCGHLFCWTCVSEWCREKPECPLCRQACHEQNLLPLA